MVQSTAEDSLEIKASSKDDKHKGGLSGSAGEPNGGINQKEVARDDGNRDPRVRVEAEAEADAREKAIIGSDKEDRMDLEGGGQSSTAF